MTSALVAGGIVAGLAGLSVWAWRQAKEIERQSLQLVASEHVCAHCQDTPVLVPGSVCAGCTFAIRVITWQMRALMVEVEHTCPLCDVQRVPGPGDICGVCLHDFHADLDKWGVS